MKKRWLGSTSTHAMNRVLKVGFCVSGEGRLFRAAAKQAGALGVQAALLIVEDKSAPDLEDFCRERSISFYRLGKQPRATFDEKLSQLCIRAQLDLLVLTFDKLLPTPLVQHYAGRIINVHPALLPAFKGMRALEQSTGSGTRFVGATIHEVDEQMDHGPVIAQCVLGLRRAESTVSVGQRLFPLLRLMYLQVITWYAEGRITKDAHGGLWVRDATYGELPISPAPEKTFPD